MQQKSQEPNKFEFNVNCSAHYQFAIMPVGGHHRIVYELLANELLQMEKL